MSPLTMVASDAKFYIDLIHFTQGAESWQAFPAYIQRPYRITMLFPDLYEAYWRKCGGGHPNNRPVGHKSWILSRVDLT